MPGPGLWGAGDVALLLESGIKFKAGGPSILSGTVDPSAVATDAVAGSLYLNTSNGNVYRKTDNGVTTGWGAVLTGAGTTYSQFGITIDGGGSAITTGLKGFVYVPYDCTIVSATLMADQSGSCVIDVWNRAFASFPPTVTQTITASALPTLSTAQSSQNTTLTGWTTSLLANSVLAFNVNSATTVTRVTLNLKVSK